VAASPDTSLPHVTTLSDEVLSLEACTARPGHLDELRGQCATESGASESAPTRAWASFFSQTEGLSGPDLDQRLASLRRQVRENGVTYNVYADEHGPQRPWSLDLFPLLLEARSWAVIESGVRQRMCLLEKVLADTYGPQELIRRGLLPAALVHGHPGYLRAMHGVEPAGGVRLHIAAFDLAHGPDGHWWVVGQRCQAPSGLGYLLENRLAISGQFPQAFQALRVQRLAATYRTLMDSLRSRSPAGAQAHIALLTPGPYNETYFEHAYLARYLGLTLVEGSDLVVRDERLFLKTLNGLVPVHALLKRVDDLFLDPLELRADSTLGVPGLLQAVRAGNLLVANAPGTAFLESPALLGFLPALSEHLLGESLQLPALPTWWCGEEAALHSALPKLRSCVIKPTYPASVPHGAFDTVLGQRLSEAELAAWAQKLSEHGEDYTVQEYVPLSQMPTWQTDGLTGSGGHMAPRSLMLRVFAVSDAHGGWSVLPGGLARLAGASQEITSMQHGGSSADVWALTEGDVDTTSLLQKRVNPAELAGRKRVVTSRAAENLFWLGRYSERAENTLRLARLVLDSLNGEEQNNAPLLQWLGRMAVAHTLVLPGVPGPAQARRVFERALMASLDSRDGATSVGFNLRALKMAASAVRERLSQEHWRLITRTEEEFAADCAVLVRHGEYASADALRTLKHCSERMAAITGAQTDRMTRDDGWRLLSIGRLIERLSFLASSLETALEPGLLETDGGFQALLALFDSSITFHAQYQQSRQLAALLDLLVLDRDNPRSLGWVAHTLRGRLARLAGSPADSLDELSLKIPDPKGWTLAQLCQPPALQNALQQYRLAALELSEAVSARYFTHTTGSNQSVGNA
jgi:uncharacterized circularly permuted ATP-grasp superfamily protein/uncharacterized alpha-E superfamily protein